MTNLKIATSEDLDSIVFDKIASKDYREGFLSMKQNTSDGHYTLTYSRSDGKVVKENHGYYTNGGATESWIRFEITNDSTLVKFGEFPRLYNVKTINNAR